MRSAPFRWRRGTRAATLHTCMKTIRHVYSAPYALLEPTLVRVVVDGDEVVGFATGPIDTLLWEDVLERSWWPALRRRYPDPEEASFASWTADQRRASAIHRPERERSHPPGGAQSGGREVGFAGPQPTMMRIMFTP